MQTIGHKEDFALQTLSSSPCNPELIFVDTSIGSALSELVLLSKFFQVVKREAKAMTFPVFCFLKQSS